MQATTNPTGPRANVIAWNKGDRKVTLAQLAELPAPERMGSKHRPIPHNRLVETLQSVTAEAGLNLTNLDLVLNADGKRLFGGALVSIDDESPLAEYRRDTEAFALVWRSGNGGRVALEFGAGKFPFICSNLDLSADAIIMKRKHTVGLRLESELREAVERYVGESIAFSKTLEQAENTEVEPDEARLIIFRAFEAGLLAPRMFPHVARNFFAPTRAVELREAGNEVELERLLRSCDGQDPSTWTDCWAGGEHRTRRELHSAFTRAIRPLSAQAKLAASRGVARILLPGDPQLN